MKKTEQFVVLYQETCETIQVEIIASILDNGELLIAGVDSGELVQELQGDWDYEYFISVPKESKKKLIGKVNQNLKSNKIKDDKDLLNWLSENYNHSKAYSSLYSLLDDYAIEYSKYTF